MYQYSENDQTIINERVAQFRDQTRRYLKGELSDAQFLPLRLQNGLYIQRHAPMLRVAIPYGLLSSDQLRMLGTIAQKYDKNYGHFTTRQNIQYNWPKLEQIPDILADLATVQMHAIQTSGNCIRNVTSDPLAGVIKNEVEDPRPYCELIRQWSTFHPEFAFLPRKFKIAVNGATDNDRAAVQVHDIGIYIIKNDAGETGFQIIVGGGLGRTPIVGTTIKPFLEKSHLLSYLEAILRVYNRYGRRDNKYKARIKILVKALSPDVFAEKVAQEWDQIKQGPLTVPAPVFQELTAQFVDPQYADRPDAESLLNQQRQASPGFQLWLKQNTHRHKKSGYAIVSISLKPTSVAPGDVTGNQMIDIAQLADQYSFGEIRVTHHQNLCLPDVAQTDLFELWQTLKKLNLATPTIGNITDVICCPGGDFCALANAKSIPIAEEIQRTFSDLDYVHDLGEIELNISGCMNACGHHHVGNIGILGVDKKGAEFYQISIGGSSRRDAAIGKILGPSFGQAEVPAIIKKLVDVYVDKRIEGETFLATYNRIGIEPYKEAVYDKAH